jgi:hypothetical protein
LNEFIYKSHCIPVQAVLLLWRLSTHTSQIAVLQLQGRYCYSCSLDTARNKNRRSQIFSRFLGLIFTGVAFGPSLGGIAERVSGNPFIIFYLALGLHFIHALFLWFVIPESLLPAQMDAARRRAERKRHWYNNRFLSFLTPLAVLAPVARKEGVTPQQALTKDWSLTWLALSYAPDSLVLGSMPYWFQYAAGKFNWTAEFVGVTQGTQSTDSKSLLRSDTT